MNWKFWEGRWWLPENQTTEVRLEGLVFGIFLGGACAWFLRDLVEWDNDWKLSNPWEAVGALATFAAVVVALWTAQAEARRRVAASRGRGRLAVAALTPRLILAHARATTAASILTLKEGEFPDAVDSGQAVVNALDFIRTSAPHEELLALAETSPEIAELLAQTISQAAIALEMASTRLPFLKGRNLWIHADSPEVRQFLDLYLMIDAKVRAPLQEVLEQLDEFRRAG